MRWSYTIGRIRGTEIKVHLTFLLLLVWFGWSAYREAGAAAAAADVVFLVAFFCSILLHEFGHCLVCGWWRARPRSGSMAGRKTCVISAARSA